jgi:hypothetical protein
VRAFGHDGILEAFSADQAFERNVLLVRVDFVLFVVVVGVDFVVVSICFGFFFELKLPAEFVVGAIVEELAAV